MKTIKITKDDFLVSTWNGEIREYEKSIPDDDRILALLSNSCEIDDGVTLKDIFVIVERYPSLVSFMGDYSKCFHINDFHQTAKEPQAEDTSDSEYVIDYLEIYKSWHVNKYKGKISFSINEEFHGIGHYIKETDHHNIGDKERISVSYSPMNEIVHYEVKLNPNVSIFKPFDPKNYKQSDERVLIEGETYFTLLEVLNAIYYDISFVGGPEDKEDFLEEMKERVDDIKDGTAELIPMDDVFFEDLDDEDWNWDDHGKEFENN